MNIGEPQKVTTEEAPAQRIKAPTFDPKYAPRPMVPIETPVSVPAGPGRREQHGRLIQEVIAQGLKAYRDY